MPRVRKQHTKPRTDHERRLHRIELLEQRAPWIKHISRHPKYGHWFPVIVSIIEVGGSFVAIIIVSRILQSIAFPSVDVPTPNINVPDLPSIPFPNISLPQWLSTTLEVFFKLLPIIIAVGYAVYIGRRNKKQ